MWKAIFCYVGPHFYLCLYLALTAQQLHPQSTLLRLLRDALALFGGFWRVRVRRPVWAFETIMVVGQKSTAKS